MSAQLTYGQNPAIGFAGMIAENFYGPKQIDSGLLEDTFQVMTSVQSTDYVASNSAAITIDGVAVAASPVVWVDTHANQLAAVAAALLAEDSVTAAVVSGGDTITLTFADYAAHVISIVVTGGSGQPTYTNTVTVLATASLVLGAPVINGSTDAQYQVAAINADPVGIAVYVSGSEQATDGTVVYGNLQSLPIMKKGRFFGVANAVIAKGASVAYDVAAAKYSADSATTTNAFCTAVTSSTATGDIIILEIDKV